MRVAACMTSKPEPKNLSYEQTLWKSGLTYIAGFDEAGRGALAGPVVVGAIILPGDNPHLPQILACSRDSKRMTSRQRELCLPAIQETALAWSVAFASPDEIDAIGIVAATRWAAARALMQLSLFPDYLLTDFRLELPEFDIPQTSLVRGDSLSLSISSASILAKTSRDAYMRELDTQVPGYGLGQNKGYGTQAHRSAMMRLGYSPIHRKSFSFKTVEAD